MDSKEGTSTPVNDDIERALLQARRIFLADAVTNKSATEIIRKLWYLELSGPGQPITLIINSPGGAIDAGFAIWDQIKMLTAPVTTLVTGLAASMGSVLSLCAAPGRRLSTANARFMIHQPALQGEFQAEAVDLEIQAKEMLRTWERIIDVYVQATGHTAEEIALALDRDKWMSAEEAKAYGLIDRIVHNFTEL